MYVAYIVYFFLNSYLFFLIQTSERHSANTS